MKPSPNQGSTQHGLAFFTLVGFIAGFAAARAFTTLFPTTVVVSAGIHFHHFWYGLAMVVTAGWLSIVTYSPRFNRVYALVFGVGAGLIGDEIGLLLTFGDYYSTLTYEFFVAVLCIAGIGFLLFKRRAELERDVFSLEAEERLLHLGVFLAAISTIAFAVELDFAGFVMLFAGVTMVLTGWVLHRR